MGASSTITYTEKTEYTPTDPDDIEITIDSDVQDASTYTINANNTVTFNEIKQASATMDSIAETSVTTVSPAAAKNLNITIDGTLVPVADYSIHASGTKVVFDTARTAGETMTAITHATGSTLDSITSTEVAAFTPTATGKLTVEIDNALQAQNTYTINGNQITFNEAKPASATMTAFLHSEEVKYTFGITATDTVNNQGSLQAFAMYVSKPGIALITPKREVGLVRVAYDNSDSPVVPLAAATYNQGENVTLSLTAGTAGNLAGSGLTFESITGVGTVEGGLEGSPASLAEDTDFTITVKAVETGEPSYNNERTLTIKILQDPAYVSPS